MDIVIFMIFLPQIPIIHTSPFWIFLWRLVVNLCRYAYLSCMYWSLNSSFSKVYSHICVFCCNTNFSFFLSFQILMYLITFWRHSYDLSSKRFWKSIHFYCCLLINELLDAWNKNQFLHFQLVVIAYYLRYVRK